MNIIYVFVTCGLFIGLAIAILFEQYLASLVLLGATLMFGLNVAYRMRYKKNDVTFVPAHKIKILGYPLEEIKSEVNPNEIKWEQETKGEKKYCVDI